ncbi:hypothetical protein [Halobacillus seohaensis]|uniref:DUF2157 domain-containing protein n=1 Tax=Halobacillus seohaensis TaxID=447421 RepID=A0ABW2EKS4_9BACI
MSERSNREREESFHRELENLKNNKYITEQDYIRLFEAHKNYLNNQQESVNVNNRNRKILNSNDEVIKDDDIREKPQKTPESKKMKPKKQVSKEQVRERNITWSLILGVVLLLISGLFVATSQWDQMESGLKVFSIFFVSLFFLGLSFLSRKYLKINQTSFAFLTLGSLLIPIAIFAIGYFELWGSYLSIIGEGRYVLGLMGALIPLPLYVRNAFQHKSRLFVWISFIFLSLSFAFVLGSLKLSVDTDYLFLMLYNAVLLFLYVRLKEHKKLMLFTKEMPLYVQANLILSTLMMMFLFEVEIFYSFNLLLTASLYMAMVFVYKTKEYQFVFSALFAYSVYQLVEHTTLQSIDTIIYASVGIIYLGFAYAGRQHDFIKTSFLYTSGVISFFAFIYVSYQGILIQSEEGSVLLMLAYLVVALNYGVLAFLVRQLIFQYLTPAFIYAAFWQLWLMTEIPNLHLEMFMFGVGTGMLLFIGVFSTHIWLKPIKDSSFYTAVIVMVLCVWFGAYVYRYGETSLMLFVVGVLAYIVARQADRKEVIVSSIWLQPVSWFLAHILLYELLVSNVQNMQMYYGSSLHFATGALILIGVSVGYQKIKQQDFSNSNFYVGQGVYLFAILLLLDGGVGGVDSLRSLLLFIGAGLFTWLVLRTKIKHLWMLPSLTILALYMSLIPVLSLDLFSHVVTFMMFAPVLLIVISTYGSRKWPELKSYFFWTAHVTLIPLIGLILVNQIYQPTISPIILIVPMAVYVYSTIFSEIEWKVKSFLYLGLAVLFGFVKTVSPFYNWFTTIPTVYSWLVASIIFSVIWFIVPSAWKKRIEWFIIPFSILGLFTVIYQGGLSYNEMFLVIGYLVINCFFIERRKWSIVNFIPLSATLFMWDQYRESVTSGMLLLLLVLSFVILVGVGRILYDRIVIYREKRLDIDSYSWVALTYTVFMATFIEWGDPVWIKITPLLLLGFWFILNRLRWGNLKMERVFETLGVVSFYSTYLLIVHEYKENLPDLIIAELQSLPLIGVLIFIRNHTWKDYRGVLSHVQLGLLLFISAYLVVDAIQNHTIWDAWIIGGLSLLSMIVGMQLRIKSYFFVGMGVLIFNVIYQTKPYWGNMPWWAYLLITGFLLIGIASYNEWQKQQNHKPIDTRLKKIWNALKRWN